MKQLTLGELITGLVDALKLAENINQTCIYYDFGDTVPTDLDSWRGSYDEGAIGYEELDRGNHVFAKHFLEMLQCDVDTFREGYKGGTYKMYRDIPIWCANYGNSGHTAICGVRYVSYDKIILDTCYWEY